MTWYRLEQEHVYIHVRATPGAAKTQIQGLHGDYLKVAVHAPAQEGAANEELVKFLAKHLGLRRQQVELVRGLTARYKLIKLERTNSVENFLKLA